MAYEDSEEGRCTHAGGNRILILIPPFPLTPILFAFSDKMSLVWTDGPEKAPPKNFSSYAIWTAYNIRLFWESEIK